MITDHSICFFSLRNMSEHKSSYKLSYLQDYSASKGSAYSSKSRRLDTEEDEMGEDEQHKDLHDDMEQDQSSGAEYDMSD